MRFRLSDGTWCAIDEQDKDLLGERPWMRNQRGIVLRTGPDHPVLARLVLGRMLGHPLGPRQYARHRNGNKLDCTRKNLKMEMVAFTHARRPARRTWRRKKTSSSYKGVYWASDRRRWMAKIQGRYIGTYHAEEDAAQAYDREAIDTWGDAAFVNFPDVLSSSAKKKTKAVGGPRRPCGVREE